MVLFFWQYHVILGNPGVVESPEIRKRAISTKLFSHNSIGSISDSAEKITPPTLEMIESFNGFQPMKITHDDVVPFGSNTNSPFLNGGIIFAIGEVPSTTLRKRL